MRNLVNWGAAAVVVAGCSAFAGQAGAADPIKIGSILSVTGPASFLGEPEKKTLEMYVERINKEGGVMGRKIELVVYDDGGAGEKASTFTKRLIESDKVDLLIGGSTTATTMAAVPLAERNEVPFISLAGAVVIVDPVKKWVFKTPHTDKMAAEKVFSDMKKRGITKIGMISEDAGFGKSGHDQSKLVAGNYGIEIVADEIYSPKDPDVTAQLTKIKNAAGVQAVFNFGFGQGPAIVTKNFKQLGIALPLYQSHGVASKDFIKLAGDAADGVRLPAAGQVIPEQLAATDPQKPVVTAFKKDYETAFKSDVSTFAGHAYDGLQIALAAINRAKSTDRAKVRDEIEKTSGYVGTGGLVSMSPTDHMGLSPSAFHMLEIRKGDWVLID
ncbi:Branched-chain amino acid ABC transporter amino acid-binding protein [Paramagnetospirillum magnetotacticum MS-1]|uniref:Branched-chain amino acid ABC transporter amino acid-binding protein n=1 Tax=Paramagnetospirillum magnetotacticum MS-1 TaxID=272627 RepID=A0A0C2UD85_PARME|nr:ABC transporter substrate-binding protein [Paramagnetospirillum magnetotacticum]KIL99462.1 Branched-chain amino acid ABC transporter amino acid-binding protein [Paramagnetospirillum magnetotacticum MS-1]